MREGQTRATNDGNVPRGSSTLSGAPNWLAAESVSATKRLPPRYKMRVHAQCQYRTTNKSRERSCSWVRSISECHNDCPALGMCARMWSAT